MAHSVRRYFPTQLSVAVSPVYRPLRGRCVEPGDASPFGRTRQPPAVNLYKPTLTRTMDSMNQEDRQFIIEQLGGLRAEMATQADLEKLAVALGREFKRQGHRFDALESRMLAVEGRLTTLEGRVDAGFSGLAETLEQEMTFTSDARDDLSARIAALEAKVA